MTLPEPCKTAAAVADLFDMDLGDALSMAVEMELDPGRHARWAAWCARHGARLRGWRRDPALRWAVRACGALLWAHRRVREAREVRRRRHHRGSETWFRRLVGGQR